MKRPQKGEYPEFLQTYLSCLPPRGTATTLLQKTWKCARLTFQHVTDEQALFRYDAGKWSIKELLMHLIDTERIFSFRMLWFMRGDRAPLPGFNQDHWMEQVDVSQRSISDLMKEWKNVRENTLFLVRQCTEAQSKTLGTASNWKVSARTYAYAIVGHQLHHFKILQEKYKVEVIF